jgi:hypothetical protein
MTATLLPPILRPNAAAAYAALDHLYAHPELHDESVLIRHNGDRVVSCYGTRTVLCAGHAVDTNGDVVIADLPDDLAEDVHYLLDGDRDVDPEYPRLLADVAEVAQVLLRITEQQAGHLFGTPANIGRRALRRLIEEIFGPRPQSAEPMHWADYQGRALCSPASSGRATGDPFAVTCRLCLPLLDAGSARLLAAVYSVGVTK